MPRHRYYDSLFAIRPRYLIQFDCIRRQLALSSSRATPLNTCSALRPRWCPQYSPYRIPDCCLPPHAQRRLSPLISQKVILTATTIHFSGLNYTACILAPPGFRLSSRSLPTGVPIGLPATLWPSGTFAVHSDLILSAKASPAKNNYPYAPSSPTSEQALQRGICLTTYAIIHWVTISNFIPLCGNPNDSDLSGHEHAFVILLQ